MLAARLLSLDTGILFLEGRDFCVDRETDNPLGCLVSSNSSVELQSSRIILGFDAEIRALVINNRFILNETKFSLFATFVQFASSLAPRADHAGLRSSVKFVVVTVVDPCVPRQLRQRTFDLHLHF